MSTYRETSPVLERQDLAYDDILSLSDSKRYFRRMAGNNLYLFDHHSGGVFAIDETLIPLLTAKDEGEFLSLLLEMEADDRDAGCRYLLDIIEQEDAPPLALHTLDQVSNIKINVDSVCNLNCRYCFRDRSARQSPDMDSIKRAIDYTLFEAGRNAAGQSIGVNLTAEPLLNTALLSEIGAYIKQASKRDPLRLKNVGFFFITNGTIADRATVKLVKKMRNEPFIHVSIDGPREVHDRLRVTHSGSGTYDTIVQNLKVWQKAGLSLRAESVLTRLFPKPAEVVLHLFQLGFGKINLKPVRAGTDYSFGMDDIEEWKEGYRDYFNLIADDLLAGHFALCVSLSNDFALKYLSRILHQRKIPYRCFWGINSFSMDGHGDYYPCDALMGKSQCRVGSVTEGLDWEKFHADTDCEKRGECGNCWARHLCGGTCHATAVYQTGDFLAIDPVECAMNKFLIECNLGLVFRLMEEGFDLDQLADLFQM